MMEPKTATANALESVLEEIFASQLDIGHTGIEVYGSLAIEGEMPCHPSGRQDATHRQYE